jgi:hypothetical protein
VTDVQIGLTSLEEVFLRIARMAEVEAAAGDTTTVELDDGGSLEVRQCRCCCCCASHLPACLPALSLPGGLPALLPTPRGLC